MWRLALSFTISCLTIASTLRAADNFPFTAYVADDEAEVRAGPGTDYYATDRLAFRAAVEVHRRDPGGWLAIRPPENSFCWVPANKLWMTDQKGIAEVVTDDALSWVGSRVENIREHKWQVRLQRGERVEILGEKKIFNEAQGVTETWHQIAPPAGEFRWIHDRSVSHESGEIATAAAPPVVAQVSAPIQDGQVRVASFIDKWKKADLAKNAGTEIQQTAGTAPINNNSNISLSPLTVASPPLQRAEPRGRENVASRVTPDDIKAFDRQNMLETGTTRQRTGVDDNITDLEAQLSLMVSKDASLWHLEKIREQTEALVEAGKTPLERGRARLLLEKVAQFEDLQRRHIQVERGVKIANASAAGASGVSGAGRTVSSFAAIEPRFDGSGTLVPVHSTKRAAPPYAIMDDDGKVLQYVTPAPGLNLNRYVRKRVGIYGQKGNAASLNAPHLTAQRVVDLERHLPR